MTHSSVLYPVKYLTLKERENPRELHKKKGFHWISENEGSVASHGQKRKKDSELNAGYSLLLSLLGKLTPFPSPAGLLYVLW